MSEITELIAATLWFWTFSTGFLISIAVTISLILCPKLWWTILFMIAWIWYDRTTSSRGGRPIQWVREWSWWKYMKNYFNYKLVTDKDVRLDAKKNYLFACYPHGVFPSGTFGFVDGYQQLFPNHKAFITALGIQFWVPIIRELFLAVGAISVTAPALKYLLKAENGGGNIVSIVIGGGDEAKYSKPGKYKIILNKRKGFIKLALQAGASVVPVFTFGETDLFEQLDFPGLNFVKGIVQKITGVFIVIPFGKYFICPNKVPVVTVVGKPINLEKTDKPSDEMINKYHEIFVEELKKLFDTHKYKYVKNPDQTFLEIV